MLDVIVGVATFAVTLVVTPVSLVVVVPAALALGWVAMLDGRGIGRFERYRYAEVLNIDITDPHGPNRQLVEPVPVTGHRGKHLA